MLNALRGGAQSWLVKIVLFGLLGLALLGLVMMDVGGVFGGLGGNPTLATVGNTALRAQTFREIYNNELSRNGLSEEVALQVGLPRLLLEREMNSMAITQGLRKSGFFIGDEQLAETLRAEMTAGGITEQSEQEALLAAQLQRLGLSEAQFATIRRNEMIELPIRLMFESNITAPQAMARLLQTYDKQQRKVSYLDLNREQMTDVESATEEEVLGYYEANIHRFLTPETRNIRVAEFDRALIDKQIEITDADIVFAYNENLSTFSTPERIQIEQLVSEDKAIIEAARNNALAETTDWQINPPSGADYLAPGTFQRSGLAPEVAVAVEGLSDGDISDVFETPLGWHVLRLIETIPEGKRELSEVREQLRRELTEEARSEVLFTLGNTIEDRLAGGDDLGTIAQEYGAQVQSFNNIRENVFAPLEGVFPATAAEAIVATALETEAGEGAPLIEISGEGYIAVYVDEVSPESAKPFEEVATTARAQLMRERRVAKAREIGANIMTAVSEGSALEDAIAASGVRGSLKTAIIARQDEQNADLTRPAIAETFALTREEPITSVLSNDGMFVLRLEDILSAEADTFVMTNELTETLSQSLYADWLGLYALYWQDKLGTKIDERVFSELFQRDEVL